MKASVILLAIFTLLLSRIAYGWSVRLHSDAEIVESAELIVIARVKPGSIKKIWHDEKPGLSYEHSAILFVSHVVKGECHETELPIIIHYGLLPISSGWFSKYHVPGSEMRNSSPEGPGESTIIFEANPDPGGLNRQSEEVHHKQIWLLRHYSSPKAKAEHYSEHHLESTDILGIWTPEDLQPQKKLNVLEKYLSPK